MTYTGTILYLEDDIGSQRLVQRVLENQGFRVLVAADGSTGIRLARDEKPALILMDMNLPGLNGKEITTRLRSIPHFANVPIVALTANTGPNNRAEALAAGCTGFMTKPIDVATFPDDVRGYLAGRVERLSEQRMTAELERYAQGLVKRLEDKITELETANERLRELDRMKSDFISLVSHELRTPLTLVNGYTALLAEKGKEAEADGNKDLGMVIGGLNTGIDRLSGVINEIIHVARIASGTLDMAMGPVRLNQIIDRTLRIHQEVIDARGLQIAMSGLDALPVVQGDGNQLKVVFGNIIGNAIKYTPDRGTITITAEVFPDAVRVTISDTGVGIPQTEQNRIFQQFHILGSIKHHSTSKSNYQGGGLGLGLPIAKGIVEAHGGRIWVESERHDPDNPPGSTFHVLLPLIAA